jgi:hypothetical protein
MDRFQSSRKNGKSNKTVFLELCATGEAGRLFTFAEIIAALDADSSRTHVISDVRQIAMSAYRALLREQSRAVHSVRGIGYRLAEAKEHNGLALIRKGRADKQFETAIRTLQGVRWDDLDSESRKAHEGTLMLYSALDAQQRAMESRLKKVEDAIGKLHSK